MKSAARRASLETQHIERALFGTPSRRQVIKAGGVAVVLADTAEGFIVEQGMTTRPEAKVYPHPTSDQTIIVMGGWANDGIALGDMLAPVFGEYANVLAVRYAQTNIDPDVIDELVFGTMKQHGLHNPSWYLNSGAGLYASLALARHARSPLSQQMFGPTRVVQFHDSPSSEYDLTPVAKVESVLRADTVVSRSRILNLGFGALLHVILPGGEFRDPSLVSQAAAANQHAAMKRTDLITASAQLSGIRDINLPAGYLTGAAQHFVYIHPEAKNEQLVVPEDALAGWRRICGGNVRDVLDTNTTAKPSHATSTFPRTLDNIFREYLVA